MHFSTLALASTAATLVAAGPFSYPLPNGFPNANASPSSLQPIFKAAGGGIPGVPPPSNLTQTGTRILQLLSANELVDIAFISQLLTNITTHVPGYEKATAADIKTLTAFQAQGETHALAIGTALESSNKQITLPCPAYQFPVSDFDSALVLLEKLADVLIGTLFSAQLAFASDGVMDEFAYLPLLGSMVAQAGEKNGYYRTRLGNVAAASPYKTGGDPKLFYSTFTQFFAGACPSIDVIGLTATPALTITSTPYARNSTLSFSIQASAANITTSNVNMAYLSGPSFPKVLPIRNINTRGGRTTFTADFPFDLGFSKGLTLALLVDGSIPSFQTGAALANATVAGPGLIIVN